MYNWHLYAWVVPLIDEKSVTIVDAFQKTLDDSKRKPDKISVDQGSEFYNDSFKIGNKLYVEWKGYDNSFNSWIDKNDIEWNSLQCSSIV